MMIGTLAGLGPRRNSYMRHGASYARADALSSRMQRHNYSHCLARGVKPNKAVVVEVSYGRILAYRYRGVDEPG